MTHVENASPMRSFRRFARILIAALIFSDAELADDKAFESADAHKAVMKDSTKTVDGKSAPLAAE